MSTITKEQLRERAREKVKSPEFSITQTAFANTRAEFEEELELARIALASLEAEPVFEVEVSGNHWLNAGPVDDSDFSGMPDGVNQLYSAPPEPVSVPDAMEMDDDFDSAFEHGKAVGWNACRAAMLQGAENAESRCTIQAAPVLDSSPKNAESRCSNSPVIADGWKLVPVEPTPEMQSAAAGAIRFDTTPINKLWTGNAVYKAMLAAAPQQE